MRTTSLKVPPADLLHALSDSINALKENHSGLITVLCPTNTSSVFIRRQYEQLAGHSLGVRFSTIEEVNQLLEDAALENTLTSRFHTIAHFDTCVSIAQQLFPQSSAWVKAPLVRTTLDLLYSMDEEFYEQALNDYELVRLCSDLFHQKEQAFSAKGHTIPIEKILGECIILGYADPDHSTKRFMTKYKSFIAYDIFGVETSPSTNVQIFETSQDEIDYVLETFLSQGSLSLNNCALVVPDNKYKRLALAIAQRKGIATSGSSPDTIAVHPFFDLAQYFLNNSEEQVSFESIAHFVELFPWIKNPSGKHPSIECKDRIRKASYLGEYFSIINEFINENICIDFFLEEEYEYSPSKDCTQQAFSLLKELSQSTARISRLESFLLLKQQANKRPLRTGSLGSGLYVALPEEIYGSCFEQIFVCSLSDKYVAPSPVRSSFIPRDQYERYHLSGKSETEQHSQNIMSWLRCCSNSISLTSSTHDLAGKIITLPHWAQPTKATEHADLLADFPWNDCLVGPALHLNKLVSSEMNNVNSLSAVAVTSLSATGIEVLARCPSQFFHQRILRAQTPQVSLDPDELLPTVLGTLIHTCLEEYVNNSLTQDQLIEIMRDRIKAMAQSGVLPHNASSILTTDKLTRIILNFIDLDRKSQATSVQAEVEIHNEVVHNETSITLRGTIDRIQQDDASVRTLVDYKTGKFHKSGDPFHFGRKIQLAIYALMLEETVDQIEYWHLGEDEAVKDTMPWDEEAQQRAKELLFSITDLVTNGVFIPREQQVDINSKGPVLSSACKNCDVEPYCYQEQRQLWPHAKKTELLFSYAQATGEDQLDRGESK
ncbi:MAG TPA: PD-(D/E)XK nuclease family protein [Acidimicrobiia bacterium]|nr:PD-(D/E)XK nuclease family protein [Acidimicrobiia bacterium]